jgi:hypothetical protein
VHEHDGVGFIHTRADCREPMQLAHWCLRSWLHVPRFEKQNIFDLNGRGFNAAASLGSEDHQLGGVLPRTPLLDMAGFIQDEGPHVRKRGERGAVLQHDRACELR